MLLALALRKASKLRHNNSLALLEKLRHFTSSGTLLTQQNQNNQNNPSPAIATPAEKFLPGPPPEPGTEECCGKGCEECVWTVYWNNLRDYQIAVAEAQGIERTLDPFEQLERRLAEKEKEKKNVP